MSGEASRTQPLAAHGTNLHSEPEGEGIKTTSPAQLGNSQSYLLRRLARDRPDLLERVSPDTTKPPTRRSGAEL